MCAHETSHKRNARNVMLVGQHAWAVRKRTGKTNRSRTDGEEKEEGRQRSVQMKRAIGNERDEVIRNKKEKKKIKRKRKRRKKRKYIVWDKWRLTNARVSRKWRSVLAVIQLTKSRLLRQRFNYVSSEMNETSWSNRIQLPYEFDTFVRSEIEYTSRSVNRQLRLCHARRFSNIWFYINL